MGFWRSRWKPETVSCRHSVRTAAAALWIRGKVGQYADHVTVKKADVYGENGEIEFAAEYQEEIPFFETVLENRRRLWL